MQPEFSEFSYGFVLTSELISKSGLKAVGAPVLPSLSEEGQLGYDVKLPGVPVFLQFKLCEEIVRPWANYVSTVGCPHLRMYLRRSGLSKQHQLLIDLEKKGNNFVYYATPEFLTTRELDHAYRSSHVATSSAFWSPRTIGPLPDDLSHCLAFKRGGVTGFLFSPEGKLVERAIPAIFEPPIRASLVESRQPRLPTQAFFRELSSEMLDLYRAHFPYQETLNPVTRGDVPLGDARDEAALISQTLFDCALLFVTIK